MKHTNNHDDSVPLSNLFVSLALLDDLPVTHCERSGVIVETAPLHNEVWDWLEAATHMGAFRGHLASRRSQTADLRIDVELTTPAGAITDGETLIEGEFNQRTEELTGTEGGTTSNHPHSQTVENVSLAPTVETTELLVEEQTDERTHLRGKTSRLERDVQCQVLPIGVLTVDIRLRLEYELKPSGLWEGSGSDDSIEPLDLESIDTADIGSTVVERLATTLDERDATNVVFGSPIVDSQNSGKIVNPQAFTALEPTDSDISQTPFTVNTSGVTVTGTEELQFPETVEDQVPFHVALIEIELIGSERLGVDLDADATVWIPLPDAEHSGYSHTALAEAVVYHAMKQYEWSGYNRPEDDLQYHVWDPEAQAFVEASEPTDEGQGTIARRYTNPDGGRVVSPITDTNARGITRVQPCDVGVIEVSCHSRLYRPSDNRFLGPAHEGRQKLYEPLWTNVPRYSRQLLEEIADRSDGVAVESLRLAWRV